MTTTRTKESWWSELTGLAKGVIIFAIAAVVALIVYFGFPYLSKITGGSDRGDLRGGLDNFIGWAPGVMMNNGLEPNKDSRMYKEFGLTVGIQVIPDQSQQMAALKSGDVDFIFTTTDISPIQMDEGSDLVRIGAQQFLQIVDSRGGDAIVCDISIETIEQLRGKKIAVALGWPSNSMLDIVLKAGGLTEHDVQILEFSSPVEAKNAYISGNADAAVVWSPDDFICMDARPSNRLITTEDMPNTIVDVFVARKETLEKKKDLFVAMAKAWLTANAEMQNAAKMEEAAKAYKIAFELEDDVKDLVLGLQGFRFNTLGDNKNFFGLSTDYTGITGREIYNKMSRVYKNGYGNNLKNVIPWGQASNSSIIEAITGLDGETHQAEGTKSFSPIASDSKEAQAKAVATKRVSVNFTVNSAQLSHAEKDKINREVGGFSKEFAGFRIRIEGNTDITGSRDLNIRLSKERAQAVADYLVKEYDFNPNRFIVIGNGPDKPIQSNDTETGRAANRRTDFELVRNE